MNHDTGDTIEGMITALLFDFSGVLLSTKQQPYIGELNPLYAEIKNRSDFQFFSTFSLNTKLLDFLNDIKDQKELYIFTSGSIQNDPALGPHLSPIFRKIFSAKELGINKKEPTAYAEILRLLGKKGDEVLFIDDTPTNCAAANQAGLKTIVFTQTGALIDQLRTL